MAYNKKKYIRINWKNRPSTATALGATNLNHMDVFLNDVDNALIEMDSGKLNVETANSMIASITFDKDKGLMTVRELNGTTYTYDWNVEKIPVSFSLSEDGILTMTTQDGTQFTANIADLIKDYVFDDSDTIAFTKEFQTEDNSYHVGASVKNGSIKAEHLDPDYRTDIQNFSNVAQTAANDALTYSKDSKRWAVGDASYEGSETDNSKYYKEQAENARDAAEKARDEAQAATGAVIMAPGVLGVGKPDNTTIKVTEDGTMSVPKATSDSYGLVKPDNTTIGQEDGAIRLIAKAASLLVTDTQGFVGDKNSETNVQLLIDAIADKMVKQLVSNSALTQQLANYVAKSMMSNIQVNDTDKVPTSALAYAMQQAITANANGITQLNNNMSKFDVYHRDVTGSLNDDKIIQTALEDFKTSIVTNKPILVEIQNHLGGRALAVGIQSLSNYNSFLVITYYDRPKEFVYALNHWEVYELVTKSDLGDLITHRKTTGNTSDSGNITINRPEGYSLIGAYINSVYVRLSIPTVYQKTIIVRCFDENMSPLKNTLVEVISLWIKKDISY